MTGFRAQMGSPVKSDSAVGSKLGYWEPRSRGLLSLSVKNALFGAVLFCTCVAVLVYNVRYARFVLRDHGIQGLYPRPAPPRLFVDTGPLNVPVPQQLHYHNSSDDQNLNTVEIDIGDANSETDGVAHVADMDSSSTDEKDEAEELEAAVAANKFESALVSEKTSAEILPLPNEEIRENASVAAMVGGDQFDIPRVIPKQLYWKAPKKCATAEEMGAATVGDIRDASLRVRAMIRDFIAEHGAERVGALPGVDFCQRGFVLGEAQEDGFGNNMYKVLTAAGLAVMLNRSLIIGERGGTNSAYLLRKDMRKRAFGDFLDYSDQAFTVREVRRLWAVHGCGTNYNRPLVIHTDSLKEGFRHTRCTCDDWTTLEAPILRLKGAVGAAAIQLLLKNENLAMRRAAAKLLGNPAVPSSRPNTFGELFRAFVAPNGGVLDAVQWALNGGPDPDIALHLRMLHSRNREGPIAAATCVNYVRRLTSIGVTRRPRMVVVTDTPAIVPDLRKALGQAVEVVHFDFVAYAYQGANRSETFALTYGMPALERRRDWGAMPRWVAMVDFFLAARARVAVVSAAYRRVSTTYVQFVAALATATTLDEEDELRPACAYYSSLQAPLLTSGLGSQSGWGHSWRSFGGSLGCRNQAPQCASTALLPYTWWDAPWQSPAGGDLRKLRGFAGVDATGQVSDRAMTQFCAAARRRPVVQMKLRVPSYDEAIAKGT